MSVNVGILSAQESSRAAAKTGALKSGTEEMRAEVSFEGSSLPERLLIEQVLSC